jgi:hypothetical protein
MMKHIAESIEYLVAVGKEQRFTLYGVRSRDVAGTYVYRVSLHTGSNLVYPVFSIRFGVRSIESKDPKLNICISNLVSLLGHKIVI